VEVVARNHSIILSFCHSRRRTKFPPPPPPLFPPDADLSPSYRSNWMNSLKLCSGDPTSTKEVSMEGRGREWDDLNT
jgi:hypothetical protein